jgi:hypothetical protein
VPGFQLRLCLHFVIAFAFSVLFAATSFAKAPQGDFSIVVLPDTQYYSASYPQIFNAQTQWIAANRDALNIQLVVGVGDIVDGPTQVSQWQSADAAVRLLDGVVPYVLAIGNHDYDNVNPGTRQVANFNQWFGPSRYAGYPWYGGNLNGSNENYYAIVNLGGTPYLVLALEYIPRHVALDWADGILKANADKPAILVTHSYMYRDNTTVDQCDTSDNTASTKTNGNDGLSLWRNFVSQYPNITTVLSGHILGVGHRSDVGINGNLVNQMLVDYQGWANGGNGYLRIMSFHPSQNTVQVQTYSPYLNNYLTDAGNQFAWTLSSGDSFATSGVVQGKVRRGRIGVAASDCKPVPGASVDSASSSTSADENAIYSVGSPVGNQPVSTSDEGFLPATDYFFVVPGVNTDAPLFVYPDQYQNTLCDISNAPDHSVTFCAPQATQVPAMVRIAAQGKVTSGFINLMQLYIDGVRKLETSINQLDTSQTLTSGTHRLVAKARDSNGVFFSSTITVAVPAPAVCDVSSASDPSVTICSPAPNATVTSPVQITAQSKNSQPIVRMQLYVDGVAKYAVNADQMNTSYALASGAHRLTVTSTDAANVTSKATITVTVQ